MGKIIDPKKNAERIARLRKLGIQVSVVIVMLSGWLLVFNQTRPVVPPPDAQQGQQGKAGEKAPEQLGPDGKPKPQSSGSYVLPYTIVLMSIGLGLLLVTRVSNRRDRAQPEQYAEKMDVVEETPEPQGKKK
jgi:hypothetical protein